jgi:hypothetical protein
MTPMKTSTPSVTAGQKTKYRRLVEDAAKHATDLALGKTDTDQVGWQRVLEHGDELRDAIAELVVAKTRELSLSNQFSGEEVESSYTYPRGYKVKGITEQTNILRRLFPGIGFADEKVALRPLPPNAEGWFAIPRWEKIAPTYGEAVEKVLTKISESRDGQFYNWRKGELGPNRLRQHKRTVAMLKKLGDQQKGSDILVVPAQFGQRRRGSSIRQARTGFLAGEFGLGAFAVGIMLLTHPERLQHYDDLWIDCAGDEYSPGADGGFSHAPFFGFHDGKVEFYAYWFDHAYEHCGSASAFVSQ